MSEKAKEDSDNFYEELRKEMREKQQAETEQRQKPVSDLFKQVEDKTIEHLKGENS